ncbi:MAG: AAA family ATPase [Bacteroidaceae bacterium]|nr:AAA family ATPase [Bacteroidaceae bacterium]
MPSIKQSKKVALIISAAVKRSFDYRHEFVTPEHLLLVLMEEDDNFYHILNIFYNADTFVLEVENHLAEIESVPDEIDYNPELSNQMCELLDKSWEQVIYSSAEAIDIPHLAKAMLDLEESWATYILKKALYGKETNFLTQLLNIYDYDAQLEKEKKQRTLSEWQKLVTCMNDLCLERNPLIGREAELERTIQVLCRCDKNNPLHIGEPGVGKTALVWGLAKRIQEGQVPPRLQGSKIYQLDIGTLLAGTQYRGDMENRIKQIMDGIEEEGSGNIVYIDEIHTIVGAGAVGDSSMDVSNMLKPYLETSSIRFIGATTYEEYNKHFSRSKGVTRRFQQIDIAEPSIEDTINIVMQLRSRYEDFHGVHYTDEALRYAVEASAKHIHERFLPDKAIDLIDEAGAAMQAMCKEGDIDKEQISLVLAKMCKIESLSENYDNDNTLLKNLDSRILSQIYGQDHAVLEVVQSVQMSKAGLLEDNKPLASLLFVGPTGVGKTEIAKVLAKEMGLELVRFDMSEYTEKHTVAKLIGSPAGYVGYEDGGLLTDAIRKTPNCVLLLDEIEKAHQDIYNILLQVMDYARLTDNKGRHADFRGVVLIMTSNAGASQASQVMMGFGGSVSRGETMIKQVKKTFKPEFLNRLSSIIVFRDMDMHMAHLILEKKLSELHNKLVARNVHLTLTPEAFDFLLHEGFTSEYGAREMDRVISQRIKPLLMKEILFGSLQGGGNITIELKDANLSIR